MVSERSVTSVVLKIVEIARNEGSRAFIDSPEELALTRRLLVDEYSKRVGEEKTDAGQLLLEAISDIDRHDGRFQINLVPFEVLGVGVCTGQETLDCFRLLLPVEKTAFALFPVNSGAMFRSLLNYVSVTPEAWRKITAPLTGKDVTSPEAERKGLEKAVDIFREKIGLGDDVGSGIGNLLPFRGQTDCADETQNLFGLLHLLTEEGYLKHHSFDLSHPVAGVIGYHSSAQVFDKEDNEYVVVDPWEGKWVGGTKVWSAEKWDWKYSAWTRLN